MFYCGLFGLKRAVLISVICTAWPAILWAFELPLSSRSEALYYGDSSRGPGLWVVREPGSNPGLSMITVYSEDALYANDHPDAVALMPDDFVVYNSGEGLNRQLVADEISVDMRLKAGTERTYENRYFESIQFIEVLPPSHSGSSELRFFLVQASHTASGRTFYFPTWVTTEIGDTIGMEQESGVIDVFIRGVYTRENALGLMDGYRSFELAPDYDFVELLAHADYEISNSSIISFAENSYGLTVVPREQAEEFEQRLAGFNSGSSEPNSFVFTGSIEDIEDEFLSAVGDRIVRPLCYEWSAGLSPMTESGAANLSFNGNECVLQSFVGEMRIVAHSPELLECRPGSCDVEVVIDCSSRGAPLLRACVDFKSMVYEQFGPNGVVPGTLSFDWRGDVTGFTRRWQ